MSFQEVWLVFIHSRRLVNSLSFIFRRPSIPTPSIQKDAVTAPTFIDSNIFFSFIFPISIPPMKASPAPVVSTTLFTGNAVIEKLFWESKKCDPFFPSFIIKLLGPRSKIYLAISLKFDPSILDIARASLKLIQNKSTRSISAFSSLFAMSI